jgi:hypothetical protein
MTRRCFFLSTVAAAPLSAAAPTTEWWLNPIRLFHPNMRERDVRSMDVWRFIAACAATNANGVVISVGGVYAFYPSRVPYHYVSPALEGRDFVREAVDHGRAAGLRMIARVDFSKAREEVFRDHPDWIARRADGTLMRSRNYYRPCPNSPYSGDGFAVPVIREILRAYAVDGFHLNSGGFGGFCYCENCRQRYRAQYNAELPTQPDEQSPEWRRFLQWRYDATAENLALLQRAMQQERPEVFWTGELASLEETSWMRDGAFDMNRLSRAFSAVMSNISSKDRDEDLRWVSGMTASYLRSIGGRAPIINLKAQLREGGWPRASVPPAEYAQTAWQAVAHGAGLKMPLVGVPGEGEDERNLRVIAEVFGVLKRHSWVYNQARPAAPVALVWSQRTLDSRGRGEAERLYTRAAHGFYSALVESHVPCVVIGDDGLTAEKLRSFRALVLPDTACLDEAQSAAIAGFAAEGGGVVATFETSLSDPRGSRRPDFLLRSVFGAGVAAGQPETAQREAYLYRSTPHELTRSLGEARVVPFSGAFVRVQAGPQAVVPLVLARHRSISVAEEVDNPEPESTPLCVANAAGKGRAVYFPGTIDSFYFKTRFPALRLLLRDAVLWAMRTTPLETNAPGGVQLVMAAKPGYVFVHFINAVGRTPLDELVRVANVDVTLEVPRPAKRARALLGARDLRISNAAGRCSFRLSTLDAYEVVTIELR